MGIGHVMSIRHLSIASALTAMLFTAAASQAADDSDVGRGEQVFLAKCAICHTAARDAADSAGPNLFAIVGRTPASRKGFAYSPAMQRVSSAWTTQQLDVYLRDPQAMVTGTFMAFTGVKRDTDRAALISYLNSLHD